MAKFQLSTTLQKMG